ncbi:hypothetical protein KAK06_16400 [Ideonella sp. 4Y11]|uniref:Uncharacterized protein n=1 Tax=Ideonella aquatica TaxID=2824119 RepID=A0A941BH54_9BURK|nr:hypothetical protein [Ideonella aquatica]MBQ0960536.1 hypothetical protein [Ideonella aquatica]
MSDSHRVIEGERFDSPLMLRGAIDAEPERYIAEKPYELTKFEFAVLRRRTSSEFWFTLCAGATAGVVISIAGKALSALLDKKAPTIESWELWAIAAGVLASLVIKFVHSQEDSDRFKLEEVIDGHFTINKLRRVHLTANPDLQ